MTTQTREFWICNACRAQNHVTDGECQYCECGGPTCRRDSCSAPEHFHADHVADQEPIVECPLCGPFAVEGRIVERRAGVDASTVHEVLVANSLDAANKWVEDNRPAYRCTHEYDCCGRAYPSTAAVTDIGHGRFVISQGWYLNV